MWLLKIRSGLITSVYHSSPGKARGLWCTWLFAGSGMPGGGRKDFMVAAVRFGMTLMQTPVLGILICEFAARNDDQILGVSIFRCSCEVERSRDHDLAVNDHHLVVRYSMSRIDSGWNTGVDQEVGGRVLLCLLASVQYDLDFDPSLLSFHESLSNRCRGERVCLDENGYLCTAEGSADCIGSFSTWGEIDLP